MNEDLVFLKDLRKKEIIFFLVFSILVLMLYTLNVENLYLSFFTMSLVSLFVIYGLVYYIKKPEFIIYIFLLLISFQNSLIGLGLHNFSDDNLSNMRLLFLYKEIWIILSLVLFVVLENKSRIKLLPFEYLSIVYIIFIIMSFLFSNEELVLKIAYTRNFTMFIFVYIFGRIFLLKKKQVQSLTSFLKLLGAFIVLYGIIEFFFFNNFSWHQIFNVNKLFEIKSNANIVGDALPTSWNTRIGSLIWRRMVSTFMEPVNLSYFLSTVFLFHFSKRKKDKLDIVFLGLILLSIVLTGGKGGILLLFVSFSFYYSILILNIHSFKKMVILILITIFLISIIFVNFVPGTFMPHIKGLTYVLDSAIEYPFGHGIGSGGNFSFILAGEKQNFQTGAESGVGTILYQLGVVGFVIYTSIFFLISNHLFQSFRRALEFKSRYLLFSGSIIGFYLGSLFQENTLGIQATGLLLVITGALINISEKEKNS